MRKARVEGQATATSDWYRALLAVSEAIVLHHDLPALFHELAGRLHQVVQFDGLALVLHEAASNTMRLHIIETSEPIPSPTSFPVESDPGGSVWQDQQLLIRHPEHVLDGIVVTGHAGNGRASTFSTSVSRDCA